MIKKSELKTQNQITRENRLRWLEERIDDALKTTDLPVHVPVADFANETIEEIVEKYVTIGEYNIEKRFDNSYSRTRCTQIILS